MPITQYAQLFRFSEMCGADIPRWMRKRLESFGDDREAVQAFGLDLVSKSLSAIVGRWCARTAFLHHESSRAYLGDFGKFANQVARLKMQSELVDSMHPFWYQNIFKYLIYKFTV